MATYDTYAIRLRMDNSTIEVDYLIEIDPTTIWPLQRLSFVQHGIARQFAILPRNVPALRGLTQYLDNCTMVLDSTIADNVFFIQTPVPQHFHDVAMYFVSNM